MALSDVEIWAELGAGRLVIEPTPDADRVVSSSIDLLLHDNIVALPDEADVRGISIDPSEPDIEIMSVLSKFGKAKRDDRRRAVQARTTHARHRQDP